MDQINTTEVHTALRAAGRAYAAARGVTCRGSWIFGADGTRICRGWDAYAAELVKERIAYPSADGWRLLPTEARGQMHLWDRPGKRSACGLAEDAPISLTDEPEDATCTACRATNTPQAIRIKSPTAAARMARSRPTAKARAAAAVEIVLATKKPSRRGNINVTAADLAAAGYAGGSRRTEASIAEHLSVRLSRISCLHHPGPGHLVAARQRVAGQDGSPAAHGAAVAEDRLSVEWKGGSLAAAAARLLREAEADPEALRCDPRLAEWREANPILWGPPGAVPGALEACLEADVRAGYLTRLREVASDRDEGDAPLGAVGPRRAALRQEPGITLIASRADADFCRTAHGTYLVVRWTDDNPEPDGYLSLAEAHGRYMGRVPMVPSILKSEHPEEGPTLFTDTLARALREGVTVAWVGSSFILHRATGEEIARGGTLHEAALGVAAVTGQAPRRAWSGFRVPRALLAAWGGVRDAGESLGDFLRSAAQREIARRQGQDQLDEGTP